MLLIVDEIPDLLHRIVSLHGKYISYKVFNVNGIIQNTSWESENNIWCLKGYKLKKKIKKMKYTLFR